MELVRHIAQQPPLAKLIGNELAPTAGGSDADTIRRSVMHYYHPVGTCKMGAASDPDAVVDAHGKVYGIDNLYVADASIIPIIPLPTPTFPCSSSPNALSVGCSNYVCKQKTVASRCNGFLKLKT